MLARFYLPSPWRGTLAELRAAIAAIKTSPTK